MQDVRGEDAIGLDTNQSQVVMLESRQGARCGCIGVDNEFGAIHAGGVAIVVVMIEERMASIDAKRDIGSTMGCQTVDMTIDGSLLGSRTGEECLGALHLDAVVITLIVGFARNCVDDHRHACRVNDNAYMRIDASLLGQQHRMTGESGAATKDYVADTKLHVWRKNGTALLAGAVRTGQQAER